MSVRNYIKSIQDLEDIFYGYGASHIAKVDRPFIQKADAPYATTTTGIYNPIFGKLVWSQLNLEANVFAALPKYPWTQSGWRVHTNRGWIGGTNNNVGRGAVAEGGAIPDTVRETFAELSTKPKTIANPFDVTETQNYLARVSQDDNIGDMEFFRPLYAQRHKENLNLMLLEDVTTVAGDGMESIERVISSLTDEANNADAGDADIFGIDRSDATNSTYDAVVNENAGTLRDLTDNLIRTMIADIGQNGGETTFILTKWDTYAALQGIYDTQVRYNPLDHKQVSLGVNGIQTRPGIGVGIGVATLYGIPLIISKDVNSDTNGLGRMFFVDTSDPEGYGTPRLGIRVAKPTQYFEAGIDSSVPETVFGINKLATEGMYRTMAELICTRFNTQGKIRDLE
jgi:hypothetical protein